MIIIYKGVKVYSSKDSLFNPIGLLIQICNIWCGHCPSPEQITKLLNCAERRSVLCIYIEAIIN